MKTALMRIHAAAVAVVSGGVLLGAQALKVDAALPRVLSGPAACRAA